jgi:methyl-accepting chemotaxis protein
MATLGEQLSDLIDQQNALLATTADPMERNKIHIRIEEIAESLDKVIDTSWDQTKQEYVDAAKALGDAADAVNKARKQLEKIDDALKVVDEAISALVSLIKLVA